MRLTERGVRLESLAEECERRAEFYDVCYQSPYATRREQLARRAGRARLRAARLWSAANEVWAELRGERGELATISKSRGLGG